MLDKPIWMRRILDDLTPMTLDQMAKQLDDDMRRLLHGTEREQFEAAFRIALENEACPD